MRTVVENKVQVAPLTNASPNKMLHDARMAAMRKLQRGINEGWEFPVWAAGVGRPILVATLATAQNGDALLAAQSR